ncbi:MAG: TetR/AcrR family transcriptional regulator [Bacillota bacterium]|nr:TetR/AcrR family transcriptional regulator [Bacillota bacterium]
MSGKENSSTTTQKDTYHTVIKTAQRLFMEYGYRAVSTRQIADLCGITQPALYHHFKNKQTLYVAVIQYALQQTETALNKILEEAGSLSERLLKMTVYMMDRYEMDMSQMFHDIFHELKSDQQKETHKWWMKSFLMPVIKIIDDGIANGEMKDVSELQTTSTELAFLILNLIRSTLLPTSAGSPNRSRDIEKKASLIVNIFLHGVKI